MTTRTREPDWSRVLARLRRGVAAGDVASLRDLGLTLADGIQDRNGRCLVRRNAAYSVRLLQRAAAGGDPTAAGSLGYAYDVGKGIRRDKALALKWYRRAVRIGDIAAATNIATIYRDEGNLRLAHQWLLRAMNMEDGDAAVTAGYGYLYGIGVRRDLVSARRILRRAARATNISPYGREEALYHLAVADIDNGNRYHAVELLEQANNDGDFPEAASLLAQIRAATEPMPCRCRRHLNKHLPGHANCPQHPADERLAVA
jgi:TPR repeat protein